MKMVTTVTALALIGGLGFALTLPSPGQASPSCNQEVQADGSLLYALVYDARPIKKTNPRIKPILPKKTVGAKMYLEAQKGMTSGYLQRAARCHASANQPNYEYEHDPLRVDGVISTIRVYPFGESFVLSVTSDEPETGREIWKRAETLASEVDSSVAKRGRSKPF